jgi:hypothetical protein
MTNIPMLLRVFSDPRYPHPLIHEAEAIMDYMDHNDTTALLKIINDGFDGYPVSQSMRDFIADFITGKVTRKADMKPSLKSRDFNIYSEILALLEVGGTLTSNRKKDGAAKIVSEKFNISEEATLKVYSRLAKIYK